MSLKKIDKIFITGNPAFDKALDCFLNIEGKEKTNDKINHITLCYLTQKHPDNILIMKKLIALTEKYNFKLIVKIHPNEKIKDYLEKIDNKRDSRVEVVNNDLYGNILKSDIIVAIFSTSILEATILDKPIIAKENIGAPYADLGIGLEYKSIDQIEECINRILKDKELNNKLRAGREEFRPKRKAGEQIKGIIEKILEDKL